MRAHLLAIGVAAFLGGVGTALAVSSCDVETCMDPDAPGCLPEPVELEAAESRELPLRDPSFSTCDRMARPSVYVVPTRRVGDMMWEVDVDQVWFEYEGRTYDARCIQGDSGCVAWIAGTEIEGEITVSTKYCDTVVSETVFVERTADDCHVATEYVRLYLSTRGCLVDQPRPSGPPPQTPWLTAGG